MAIPFPITNLTNPSTPGSPQNNTSIPRITRSVLPSPSSERIPGAESQVHRTNKQPEYPRRGFPPGQKQEMRRHSCPSHGLFWENSQTCILAPKARSSKSSLGIFRETYQVGSMCFDRWCCMRRASDRHGVPSPFRSCS